MPTPSALRTRCARSEKSDAHRLERALKVAQDHVAGAVFVAGGAAVLALSRDLPFGSLAAPGAGMLPMLVVGFMIALGALLFLRGAASPRLAAAAWNDLPHALRVIVLAAAAAAAYAPLGFLITVSLLLFGLTFAVERRPLVPSLLFSVLVTAGAYALFTYALRTPLPQGVLEF